MLTLGVAALLLNGVIVWIASRIVDGFGIGMLWGIVVALVLTVVNTLVTSLLAIDDDDFYYRNVISARPPRRKGFFWRTGGSSRSTGSRTTCCARAMRDGNAPTLARWLRDGIAPAHALGDRLVVADRRLPGRAAARRQRRHARLPLVGEGPRRGDRHQPPARRRRARAPPLRRPRPAARRRREPGEHPLRRRAAHPADDEHGAATATARAIGRDYFAYFANPYNVTRTLALVIGEIVSELWSAAQQRRRDVQPADPARLHYALMRAWATVIQRDLQVAGGDRRHAYAGRPVVYTTFLAYDEVAHHSGDRAADTLAVLRRVDRQIARIAAAARDAPRPYRLVVLSDHGQSQGATFLDRYGITLEELVHEACAPRRPRGGRRPTRRAYLGAALTEAGRRDSRRRARSARRDRRKRSTARCELGATPPAREASGELPELSVMASGCLGLISFPREPGRVTLERLEELYPRCPGAARAPRDRVRAGALRSAGPW